MNIDDISAEEMEKIGVIFGQGYAQLRADYTRATAENHAMLNTNAIVVKDRDYWHSRAQLAEQERDAAQDLCEFLIRQWEGVYSNAEQTKSRWMDWRSSLARPKTDQLPLPPTADQLPPLDKPPRVVVFNRD